MFLVDGMWSDWNDWTACTESCGGGTQARHRSCDNPSPQYGGEDCIGDPSESQACNTHGCPSERLIHISMLFSTMFGSLCSNVHICDIE